MNSQPKSREVPKEFQIDLFIYMELKFEVKQIQSKADVNSKLVITWDLETSFGRFMKCFRVLVLTRFYRQMTSKSYCSCVVINLDRCHRQMMSESFHLHPCPVESASESASESTSESASESESESLSASASAST